MNDIKIVIGSWGSYNECNERALGSKWLDLSDYSDWNEIAEELKKEGFELRYFSNEWYNHILIRTAKNETDYHGGFNNYTNLEELEITTAELLEDLPF